MGTWVVRAQYPTGDVVEEFGTETETEAAIERHRRAGIPIAVKGPALGARKDAAVPPVPTHCSFCGKERREVGHLIAGPSEAGVAICDQCVALCNEIIAEGCG